MSRRLESELADLKGRLGVGAEAFTSDEIEMLVLACRRCDSPFSNVNAELCGRPVFVCKGVCLWPITAGAHIWLEEYAASWWRRESSMYRWAQVYALAHAREPDAFAELTSKWAARAAILKTMLRFVCYRGELAKAIRKAYAGDQDQIPDTKADRELKSHAQEDFSSFVARLEVQSGITATEWLWGRSMVSLAKAYAELRHLTAAFDAKTSSRMKDELDDALNDLARVKVAISRRIRAEREREAKGDAGA